MIQDHLLVGKGRIIPEERDGPLCLHVGPQEVMVFCAGKRVSQDGVVAQPSAGVRVAG